MLKFGYDVSSCGKGWDSDIMSLAVVGVIRLEVYNRRIGFNSSMFPLTEFINTFWGAVSLGRTVYSNFSSLFLFTLVCTIWCFLCTGGPMSSAAAEVKGSF